MTCFKRTSAILVCLIILLNHMPIAFATTNSSSNKISHNEYSQALFKIIDNYEPVYGALTSDENGRQEPVKTDRLIVKTNSNEPVSDSLGAVARVEGYNNIHILQYSNSALAEAAYNYFDNKTSVEYVEYDMYFCIAEDKIVESEDVPDSDEHLSWGNSAVKSDIINQMLISSNIELNDVVVAVFDSGLDVNHSRIDKSRILEGVNVWNTENPTDIEDLYEHGTAVTGVILDNTLPNIKIKPYKIANWRGGMFYSQMVNAIYDIIEDNVVDVINMSFAIPGTNYEHLLEAICAGADNGVTFVVASGNDNKNAEGYYPAVFSEVITVSATDCNNLPWNNSNWGNCVDISAPGADIVCLDAFGDLKPEKKFGTSFAVPFVVSAVAILKSIDPSLSPEEIKNRIKMTAFVPEGWDDKFGTGILDCEKMISHMLTERPVIKLNSDFISVTASPQATIYYTTDGTDPIVGISTLYIKPINISNVDVVKAIAYEDNMLPSVVVMYEKNRKKSLEMRYMETKNLSLKQGEKLGTVYVANEDIVTYEGDGKIKAISPGKTQVIVFTGNGRKVIFNVVVKFADWQWLHKLFYEWFGILLWSF